MILIGIVVFLFMILKKDFLKLPKKNDNNNNEIEKNNINLIQDNFENEEDFEQIQDETIFVVFEDKSSILKMLFLFILMIAFVLFIFFKMN